jgi:hypothetical protein
MAHALVPPTVLLAVLIAWPCPSLREALWRGTLGVATAVALLAGATGLHLAALLDVTLVGAGGEPASAALPMTVRTLLFLESGGRWLLPLACGVACLALARRAATPRAPRMAPARVDDALVALAARARHSADAGP